MKPWMWIVLTIIGSMGLLEAYPEQAGRAAKKWLKEKLGKVGGKKVWQTLIVRPLKAFLKGGEEGEADEEVTDNGADTAADYSGVH